MELTNQSPAVSVIVPVYNAASLLGEAVESVLHQNVNGLELILVDDCSTDDSASICASYAERFPDTVRFVRRVRNGGLSAARNTGLEEARGESIIFLDADDAYLPGGIQTLIDLSRKYPEAGIVSGSFLSGPVLAEEIDGRESRARVFEWREALEHILYQKPGLDHSAWGKLYRRELFEGIRFREGRWYEDMEIFPRLLMKGMKVVHSEKPVYFYRTNPASFLSSWKPGRLDSLAVTDEILELLADADPKLVKAARSLRLSANFNAFFLSTFHDEPAIADRTWQVIKSERNFALTDPNVRLKNKVGILLSYLGRSPLLAIAARNKKYR